MKNDVQKFTFAENITITTDNTNRKAEDAVDICRRIGFIPKNIVQVGAANSGKLEFHDLIPQCESVILFEPQPEFHRILVENYGKYPNISIVKLGIFNKAGKFKFYEKWAGTFLSEAKDSPVKVNEKYVANEKDAFFCECAKFGGFDNGNIDLLLIDTEGCEWYCIEELKSRPVIICVETHYIYSEYRNPYLNKIEAWMELNDYVLIARNESDSVYVRKN